MKKGTKIGSGNANGKEAAFYASPFDRGFQIWEYRPKDQFRCIVEFRTKSIKDAAEMFAKHIYVSNHVSNFTPAEVELS